MLVATCEFYVERIIQKQKQRGRLSVESRLSKYYGYCLYSKFEQIWTSCPF